MTTTITDAEVEAAAAAMLLQMFAPHELPVDERLWRKYLDTASAALTAAAQVREEVMPNAADPSPSGRLRTGDTPPGPAPDTLVDRGWQLLPKEPTHEMYPGWRGCLLAGIEK
jgi:hypothetical protein